MWDRYEVLVAARQGYRDYMEQYERDVPVLRLPAGEMSPEQVDQSVKDFLYDRGFLP
jgi:hypothetical protein